MFLVKNKGRRNHCFYDHFIANHSFIFQLITPSNRTLLLVVKICAKKSILRTELAYCRLHLLINKHLSIYLHVSLSVNLYICLSDYFALWKTDTQFRLGRTLHNSKKWRQYSSATLLLGTQWCGIQCYMSLERKENLLKTWQQCCWTLHSVKLGSQRHFVTQQCIMIE